MRNATLISALIVSLAGLIGAAGAAEPVPIRIAWNVPAGDAPFAVLGKPGIAVHEGKSYTLAFTHFSGTPQMMTALATDAIDISSLGFSNFPLAIENASLKDLRIIADVFQDGVGDHYSTEFMVLNDGPVKAVEDLKGNVVTSNGAGSAVDIALRAMLRRHGLEDKRDYTLLESAFPNMKALLLEHKVDLVGEIQSFGHDAQLRAAAHALFRQKDVMGTSQMLVMVARAGFLQRNRDTIVDFLEDNLREIRWYYDPTHRAEALEAIAAFTKTPAAAWASWAFTDGDYFRAPDGRPNLDALARNIATAHDLGFVPSRLDPNSFADLSLVTEAAARLR